MLTLPDSARVACWLNAWLAARESADAVITGVAGPTGVAEFVGMDAEPLAPALFLGEIRRSGVERVTAALPVPGDPLGLGGPPSFNTEALDAGEGLVMHGPDLGLVPARVGDLTRWNLSTARPPTYLASGVGGGPDPETGDGRGRRPAGRARRCELAS